jgi:hypothetical protein
MGYLFTNTYNLLLFFLTIALYSQDCVVGDCNDGYSEKVSKSFTYKGEFKDGVMSGYGIYTWSNGDYYDGMFKNDFFYGNGTMIYSSGTKYVGEWKYDKKHGKGTMIYNSGNQYVGEWKFGNKHGLGTFNWKNGDLYKGAYVDDLRNGNGTYTWKSGDKYDGHWTDDKRTGKGVYYSRSGNKKDGIWIDNKYMGANYSNYIEKPIYYYYNNIKYSVSIINEINFKKRYPDSKIRFYYDKKWKLIDQKKTILSNPFYYREYSNYDNLSKTYGIKAYYVNNDKLQFVGKVQNNDPSATSCKKAICEEKVLFYKEDGSLSSEGIYKNGVALDGKTIIYTKNGNKFTL